MEKRIYIVRHCETQGQSPTSPLTEKGHQQAKHLVAFFDNVNIDHIISSPFLRAKQSVEPLSKERHIDIEIDERLQERQLSTNDLPNWEEKLKATFADWDLAYEGGESSRAASQRIISVVDEVFKNDDENTVIVSHGNLTSLLLYHYKYDLGFEGWKKLSNPDVFLFEYTNNHVTIERLWQDE